jgi:hypothetical protein
MVPVQTLYIAVAATLDARKTFFPQRIVSAIASETLQELLYRVVDPDQRSVSAEVFISASNATGPDRIRAEMEMPLSVAANFVTGPARYSFILDSGAPAAATPVRSSADNPPSAFTSMMSKSKESSKRQFPDEGKLNFKWKGEKPERLYQHLKSVLKDREGMKFQPRLIGAAGAAFKELGDLLYELDKCGAMRKLIATGHALPIPALLATCQGFAADKDGRVGGSHKAKGALGMTHAEVTRWIQSLQQLMLRETVTSYPRLANALEMLASSLQKYRDRQVQSYIAKRIAVDLGTHKTLEEDHQLYLLPGGGTGRPNETVAEYAWVEKLFEGGAGHSDTPIRITVRFAPIYDAFWHGSDLSCAC